MKQPVLRVLATKTQKQRLAEREWRLVRSKTNLGESTVEPSGQQLVLLIRLFSLRCIEGNQRRQHTNEDYPTLALVFTRSRRSGMLPKQNISVENGLEGKYTHLHHFPCCRSDMVLWLGVNVRTRCLNPSPLEVMTQLKFQ
jgi:hypothetical protein